MGVRRLRVRDHPVAFLVVVAVVAIFMIVTGCGTNALTGKSVALAPTTTAAAPTTTAAPTTRPAPTTPPRIVTPDPGPHVDITGRDWALIAKDPDAHLGKRIIVYGEVFQFDSSTGPGTMLVRATGDQQDRYYDGKITLATGTATDLADVVEDDEVEIKGTVLGSLDYDTRIGGTNTAILITVDEVRVIT